MGLTDDERRRLDELADDLARNDPRLGRALSDEARGGRLPGHSARPADHIAESGRRRRLRLLAIVLAALALPAAAVGLVLALPLLFAAGALALPTALAIFTIARRDTRSPST